MGAFRAFVGPSGTRTVARSGAYAGGSVALAASAGAGRWDLVYAVLSIDANGPTSAIKVKDPTSGIVSALTIPEYKQTTVTLAVLQGAESATPTMPSVPADTATSINIPLCYVNIPSGFLPTWTPAIQQIAVVAPMSRNLATSNYTPGEAVLSTAAQGAWGGIGTDRPTAFLPTTIGEPQSLFGAIDLTTGTESHSDGDIIDSRDWRNRICRWVAVIDDNPGNTFAWEIANPSWPVPYGLFSYFQRDETVTSNVHHGVSQTLTNKISGTDVDPVVATLQPFKGISVAIVCDRLTGKLKLSMSGAPNVKVFFWLEFTGAFQTF